MFASTFRSLLLALYLSSHIHALPGRHHPAAPATTAAPTLPDLRVRDVEHELYTSLDCSSDGGCTAYNVTPIATFNATAFAPFVSSEDSSTSQTTSITTPIATGSSQGTGVPASPSESSKGPFANETASTPTVGPTGTGARSPSGTGISPENSNTTSDIDTSTLTISSATHTGSGIWGPWTGGPHATGTGVSGASRISTSCTDAVWSNGTSFRGTGGIAGPTGINTAPASDLSSPNATQSQESFKSTVTLPFAYTTLEIPVPDSFTGNLPQIGFPATNDVSETSTEDPTPSPTSFASPSNVSLMQCWTTTDPPSVSPTGNAAADSSLYCYSLSCSSGSCSDILTRYPLAATTSTNGSFYSAESATANNPEDVWPSSAEESRNSAAYTSTSSIADLTAAPTTQGNTDSTATSPAVPTSDTRLLHVRSDEDSFVGGILRSAKKRADQKFKRSIIKQERSDRAEKKFDALLSKKKAENDKLEAEMAMVNGKLKKT